MTRMLTLKMHMGEETFNQAIKDINKIINLKNEMKASAPANAWDIDTLEFMMERFDEKYCMGADTFIVMMEAEKSLAMQ